MDVKHFAFLARQPSASLQPRERFWGMPKRGIALILANAMFWQPMWAQADGIVVSGGSTSLGAAGNGVPIVNIAAPNANGLSHNQYQQYNVGSQGVILNNATAQTQSTQLGGIIIGNSNLQGQAASTILNEVVSNNRTQLKGYTEVAGSSAKVIIANPYGITCDGCGFINTPQATLTTGKPVLDQGQITRYEVQGGDVSLEGAGLNATNLDQFDIITRSAKVNAELHAKKLNIIAGRNNVDAQTLDATALADDGSVKPTLAIDSSALGGMYAGAVKLVGTEAGVGVRLASNVAASAGDIQIDANGHLSMVQAVASGAVDVKAASVEMSGPLYAGSSLTIATQGDLTVQQSVAARDSVNLSSGGQLTNKAVIEAGINADNSRNADGDVVLSAANLTNTSTIVASRALQATVTETLDNRGATLSGQSSTQLTAATLDNRGGRVVTQGTLTVNSDSADNRGGVLRADKQMNLFIGSLDNSQIGLTEAQKGAIIGKAGVKFTGQQLDNRSGEFNAAGLMQLQADKVLNAKGRIASQTELSATLDNLSQQGGELVVEGALTLIGKTLDNQAGGLVGATKALKLEVADIDNRAGEISSQAGVEIIGEALDNRDGGKVLAGTALQLVVERVINENKGLLFGQTLSLTGQQLDNTGGTLSSQQDQTLTLTGALNNSAGQISSEGKLTVKADTLGNAAGSLSSAKALKVTTDGALVNQAGSIATDEGLTVISASLDNRQAGKLSGKGATQVTTGDFNNSQGGQLTSGSTLELVAGKVINQSAGRIASALALNASVTGLDQQGGELFSNTSLTLDLNHGELNNQNGLINSPGALLLKNLGAVLNQGGEISSAQAFTLAATSLDNSEGKLLGNQSLTLRIAQALNNVKGMIAAAGIDATAATLDNTGGTLTSRNDLELTTTGLLTNRDKGLINAAQALKVTSADLNNRAGQLLGSTALTLNAAALDNTTKGLINSNGTLTITADSLDASTGGEVSALGNMTLVLDALSLNAGRLIGEAGLSVDLNGGDLNSRAGLLTAKNLTFARVRDVNNQGGEISSEQSFTLAARTLDNSGGKLISSNQLTLAVDSLINQNGLVSGWQGLGVTGVSLDNRNSGTLSSRYGSVEVTLSGDLLNSDAGALVSQKALTVTADNLDNSGGILSSALDQSLNLTVTGLLNNGQNGLIDSGADLVIDTDSLDNSAGTITSKGKTTLDLLGTLTNTGGKLASGDALLLKRSSALHNQGGQLISQSLMTLNTGTLDNSNRGTVASNGTLLITATDKALNDADGLIYSQNADVQLEAASLSNARGTLQGQTALSVDVTGDIDNQSGSLITQNGDLYVEGNSLDSRGGVLSSLKGLFTAKITGVLKNGYDLDNNRQGGVIQAQRLNLTALGGFDNYGGRVSASTGNALVTTANFDNRNGGLYAKGLVRVIGDDFDNSGDNDGQIAGNQVDLQLSGALNNRLGIIESDSTLSIKAASLDNQTGQIRSLGTSDAADFQIGTLFDNRNGTVEVANSNLILNAASFLNAKGSLLHAGKGTFDISTANLMQASGTVATGGDLTLTADNWTNTGVIQAGRLTVNVGTFNQTASGQLLASTGFVGTGGTWANDGVIGSDGALSLTLGGAYSGSGRASSRSSFDLGAMQLNLTSEGELIGGGVSTVNISGVLANLGQVRSSEKLTVIADKLNNYGTLASNGGLVLKFGIMLNERGVIFSGADMALLGGELVNKNGDVYSVGDLYVAKDESGGWMDSLGNISGTLESVGDMRLNVASTENRKEFFKVSSELVSSSIGMRETGSESGHMVLFENYKSTLETDSPSSSISSGGNLDIVGAGFLNSASIVSVRGNLNADLVSFTNSGADLGNYSVLKSFELPHLNEDKYISSFWRSVMKYNATNDPEYAYSVTRGGAFGSIRYWDGAWNESRIFLRTVAGGTAQRDTKFIVGWKRYSTFFSPSTVASISPPPSYSPSALSALPGEVAGASFFETRVVTEPGVAASGSSIVQAGGSVNINAAQNLTNSVVRGGQLVSEPNGVSFETTIPDASIATVINLHPQLSPDLVQQQVNPLTLPGFSLPTGQNGLFRLSAQTGSNVAITQDETPSEGGGQASISTHQLTDVVRQNSGLSANASAFDSTAPVGFAGNLQLTAPGSDPQTLSGRTPPPGAHKYLIETNPVLTDLRQFMSSDYLLANLGYDPDESMRRLGDGFYEQRLVQQAIVARTGQALLAGQTSNEDQFKYLMNNAIASKEQLNLAVGVSLSSQQVAALTHDIVWLEEHEVNGEKVLVPVVYLAQANNRLAPTGALIAGNDVTLIAGEDLDNVGTLRATNNLSATAGNNLVNAGLVEAGNRLDLLAGQDLVNKAGGILYGRDVTLSATRGDVINERTVTRYQSVFSDATWREDFADSAARIESANDLAVKAGRDVNNLGGILQAGRDISLVAGRDVGISSIETKKEQNRGTSYTQSNIAQLAASVSAGRDLTAQSGRDISVIASNVDAKRDIAMAATENLTLSSATNEQHSYSKSKKVTAQEDHISQVSTELNAGGSIALSATKDLSLISSKVHAEDKAYLVAGENLEVTAAANEDYSFYSKVKKSSSGKKSSLDETNSVIHVASSITAGTDAVLGAGKDLLVHGSSISAKQGVASLTAVDDVQIIAAEDSESSRHERSKSKSGWGGLKSSSVTSKLAETMTNTSGSVVSGNTVEVASTRDVTVTGSSLVSTKDLDVNAGRDLTVNAAENVYTRTELYKQKGRDLTGILTANNLGINDITGNQRLYISSQSHTGNAAQRTLTGSMIGSSEGSVDLTAGRVLTVTASDLVSTKNMLLKASDVTVTAGVETASQSSTDKSRSLAVGRVIGGMVVDTINTIRETAKTVKEADDPRLKAVKLAQATLALYQLNTAANDAASGSEPGMPEKSEKTASNGSLIKIGTELANTRSKSTSTYESQAVRQSTINVGESLAVTATGAVPESEGAIKVIGSTIKAANTDLNARNNILLLAAQNAADWSNSSKNNKTSIGASFNIGAQNGFTLDLGAQIAKARGTGSSITQVNSTLDTGALLLQSGQDTRLAGAQVHADSIRASIGGNLDIASLQDMEEQRSKQSSGGVGASICIPPFCYGVPAAASASIALGGMNSDYKAVSQQAGLYAGMGGYTIDVGKNTILQGAVIASEASADKNLLSTDRLITRDIKNISDIDSYAVSGSVSSSYSGAFAAAPGMLFGLALNDSDKSFTRSAVSEGVIVVRNPEGSGDLIGLNRDTANANEALDKPDSKSMAERIDLVRSSVTLIQDASRTIADARARAAKDPNSEEYKQARQELAEKGNNQPTQVEINEQVSRTYGTGSSFQRATQAAVAVVQGVLSGNFVGALAGGAAPYLAHNIKEMTAGDDNANLMAHVLLAAVVAQAQGNSALSGAAGVGLGELIARQLYPGTSTEQMTEAERQTVSALASLAGGLAGALTGGGDVNAIAGALAAKNAVENNYLSVEEAQLQKVLEIKEREGTITPEEAQILADTKKLDKDRDTAIQAACTAGNKGGAECGRLVAMAREVLEQYGNHVSYSLLYKDIYPEDFAGVKDILQGLDTDSISRDTAITAIVKESGLSRDKVESRYDLVMSLQAVTAALAGLYGFRSPLPSIGGKGDLPSNTITNVRAISADEANAPFVARGWNPPYDTGSQVRTFTVSIDTKFVRVSTIENPQGAFLVRAEEVAGMTPLQIQQHLALPKVPTQIADVVVPKGTNMQVGRVAAQPAFGANSKGGVQYQLLDQIPGNSFGMPRPL
ncbi:hemagglutinin repeat-containing protein [Pseudomonas sp. NPDC089734]|uniref:two-partner secretion domain-containing protein n=1 Tax=Pseudomonas sp. NPDC089734 TaxID=3364469 RepID=UPI0038258C1D